MTNASSTIALDERMSFIQFGDAEKEALVSALDQFETKKKRGSKSVKN